MSDQEALELKSILDAIEGCHQCLDLIAVVNGHLLGKHGEWRYAMPVDTDDLMRCLGELYRCLQQNGHTYRVIECGSLGE
jgi:hypothetical protein